MTAIYVASPRGEYHVARHLARDLAAAGHRIVSSWHGLPDLDGPGDETLDSALRRELLERCRADIQRAEVMVAWTARGTPRATIGEIVCMLEALGRPVIWIQGAAGEGGNIWDHHPLVTIVREHTVDAVVAALAEVVRVNTCQTAPRTMRDVEAISAVVGAVAKRMEADDDRK